MNFTNVKYTQCQMYSSCIKSLFSNQNFMNVDISDGEVDICATKLAKREANINFHSYVLTGVPV